jgi:Multiubiquitin
MPEQHEVRIHINRQPYESPNPTTGAALYTLGKIGAHQELFKEVGGDREDELIPNDSTQVHLKQDEHFYCQRDFVIIVNGQKKTITTKTVTFDDIVKLAFPTPPSGANILYTVSYEDGPKANPQGSLKEGGTVKVKDGMIFNVTATDKS